MQGMSVGGRGHEGVRVRVRGHKIAALCYTVILLMNENVIVKNKTTRLVQSKLSLTYSTNFHHVFNVFGTIGK